HTARVGERAADVKICSVGNQCQRGASEADVRPITSVPLRQTGRRQAVGSGKSARHVNVASQKTDIIDEGASASQFADRAAPVGAVEDVHAAIGGDEAARADAQTAGVELVAIEAEPENAIGHTGQAELPVPVTVSRGSDERTHAANGQAKEKHA